MWWDIVKSSRDEAYSKFLEEFGPEVDLNQIEFNDRSLTQDDWLIHMDNMGDITFHSEKYRPHLGFVQGMFKEEYPERYNEIGDLLLELISTKREREGIITSSKELPFYAVAGIEIWLKKHMIFLDDNLPTRSQKLAILISIIGYYGKKNGFFYAEGDKPLELYDIREQFEDTNNLWDLFQKYQEVMQRHDFIIEGREIITTKGQMKTLSLMLDGKIPMPSYNGIRKTLTIGRNE